MAIRVRHSPDTFWVPVRFPDSALNSAPLFPLLMSNVSAWVSDLTSTGVWVSSPLPDPIGLRNAPDGAPTNIDSRTSLVFRLTAGLPVTDPALRVAPPPTLIVPPPVVVVHSPVWFAPVGLTKVNAVIGPGDGSVNCTLRAEPPPVSSVPKA